MVPYAFSSQSIVPEKSSAKAKSPTRSDGNVAYCFDGDTLKLTDRRIVRLAGIDAPEMAHETIRAQYYAREARQELVSLTQLQKIRLVFVDETSGKDRYGRIVADVHLENGQSLSALMISCGAAFFDPHKDQHPDFQKHLLELQQKSIVDRVGLWTHLLSLPLALNNYIGNRASMRFFLIDCPEVQHIKPRNRIYFGTLMDAFLAGYAPGRTCHFWPTVP
jgi:endonuclease YncB( thermonuclease family)